MTMSGVSSHDVLRVTSDCLGILDVVDPDCFDHQIDRAAAAACVASPDSILVVAVAGGCVVGQCLATVQRHPDKPCELYVGDLGVAARYRRRGIATELLRAVMKIGRTSGAHEVWVAVEPDNVGASALYRSIGLKRDAADIFDGSLYPRPR